MRTGIMIPRAEFGLIFAELSWDNGIFIKGVYTGLIIVIALTIILPALAVK